MSITETFDLTEFLDGTARVVYHNQDHPLENPSAQDYRFFGQRFSEDESGAMPTPEAAKLHAEMFTDGVEKGIFSMVLKPGTTWMPLNEHEGRKRGLIVTFVYLNVPNAQFDQWLKSYARVNKAQLQKNAHDSVFGITP